MNGLSNQSDHETPAGQAPPEFSECEEPVTVTELLGEQLTVRT